MTSEERRDLALAASGVQLRAEGDAEPRFHGMAMLYGSRAAIGDPKSWGFFEEFTPAAAARSLAEFDQRMLIDHDTFYLVSRVSAGDLKLTDTSRGVEVDSALDDEVSYVRDFRRNVQQRRITGMSIGFMVREARWETVEIEEPRADGKIEVYPADLRVITDIDLLEVSGVTFPAYTDTEADVRSLVGPALVQRGDRAAIEHRAACRPELRDLLRLVGEERPPAEGRRQPHGERRKALAARWGLTRDSGYRPPILKNPARRATRRPVRRAFNPDQLRDPDGKWTDGMPDSIVSVPVAGRRATVSRQPGGSRTRLSAGDRHADLEHDEVEDFRALAISARIGDPGYAGSDGVYRVRRHGGRDQAAENLVSIRPVPGRYVDEDGRAIDSPEDADGEAYFAKYDVVVGEEEHGDFDDNPSIQVGVADLDPQESRSGIYGTLLRASAAERVDGGAGPIDVYAPRNGRVGFRMKGDDGKPVEVEFGTKDVRAIDRAIEAVQDEPGTRTVETSHGSVEVSFSEFGSLIVAPPSGGPWGIAASGDGVSALLNAFHRNGEAAGIFY